MKTIMVSKEKPGDDSTLPLRIVLSDKGDKITKRYATHVEVRINASTSKCWGHYFDDLMEATQDYIDRCQKAEVNPKS